MYEVVKEHLTETKIGFCSAEMFFQIVEKIIDEKRLG
jgi:hypothetical protein